MCVPGWAGTRRNIHPLTPIVVINCHLSASSIYCDPWHPLYSIHVPDSLFPHLLSKFSLVYLFAWHPPLHTPYISLPSHCLLFAAIPSQVLIVMSCTLGAKSAIYNCLVLISVECLRTWLWGCRVVVCVVCCWTRWRPRSITVLTSFTSCRSSDFSTSRRLHCGSVWTVVYEWFWDSHKSHKLLCVVKKMMRTDDWHNWEMIVNLLAMSGEWSLLTKTGQSVLILLLLLLLLLFYSPWTVSRTTRVSWYQKGKTNLDLLEQEIVSGISITCSTCHRP